MEGLRERSLTYNHILRISAKDLGRVGSWLPEVGCSWAVVGMCSCWLGYVVFPLQRTNGSIPGMASSGCPTSQKLTKKLFWGEGDTWGWSCLPWCPQPQIEHPQGSVGQVWAIHTSLEPGPEGLCSSRRQSQCPVPFLHLTLTTRTAKDCV